MKTKKVEGMKYETTKEDRSRRHAIPVRRRSPGRNFTYRPNDTDSTPDNFYSKQVVDFMVSKRQLIAVLLILVGIFIMGLATGKGNIRTFWVAIIAFVTSIVLSGGKSNGRN